MSEQQESIERVYAALDDLMQLMPGWSRFILRASEPMFQVLDSIEQTLAFEDNESDRQQREPRATSRKAQAEASSSQAEDNSYIVGYIS